ncbi:hypothetical protein [Streptomyces sp. NBC_01497]|nr:hypothetical protein [Streptomyces sp. NBC_01497]
MVTEKRQVGGALWGRALREGVQGGALWLPSPVPGFAVRDRS